MSQHFLLSAQARTLSLRKIFSLSDDQAFEMFKQSRWGHHDAICPCCGSMAKHYFIKTRRLKTGSIRRAPRILPWASTAPFRLLT
ncbi:transposase [Providencia stuartii]